MSTVAHLPSSAEPLANPSGNGGCEFTYTPTDGRMSLSWIVPWADVQAFRIAALGREETIELAPGPPPVTITRVVPLQCPFDDHLWALGIRGRALTASDVYDAGTPYEDFYGHAVLTVDFGVLPYSFTDQPYLSVRYRGTNTGITLPNHVYKKAGGTERTTQDIVIPCFQEDFIVTKHEVANLDAELAVLKSLAGMCNSAAVTVDGQTYGVHELHLPEFDAEEGISIGGARKASLSYPVRWRPRPTWQQVQWQDGSIANLDPLPLLTGSFAPLFGL